jgi:hypothetical protein
MNTLRQHPTRVYAGLVDIVLRDRVRNLLLELGRHKHAQRTGHVIGLLQHMLPM